MIILFAHRLLNVHDKTFTRTVHLQHCWAGRALLHTNAKQSRAKPFLEKDVTYCLGMGDWTVVRHKRGTAGRRTSAVHVAQLDVPASIEKSSPASHVGFYPKSRPIPESHFISSLVKEVAFELNPDDKGEEEQLLGKLRRAITKVEQSVFFSRFMKQMQDLEVLENLSRSRSGEEKVGEEEEGEDEDIEEESNVGSKQPSSSTVELVVYGVGSIANSEISRCQLALALLLKRKSVEIGSVFVYDPIMSLSDRSVMIQLGVSPLEDNDEGRRPLNGPTLFYMPHCDVELYESVLQANLKRVSVNKMVILGNSFRTYHHRWSVSPLPHGERPDCLLKVQPTVEEIPVADNFSPTAFNDTSWHFFSKVEFSELH